MKTKKDHEERTMKDIESKRKKQWECTVRSKREQSVEGHSVAGLFAFLSTCDCLVDVNGYVSALPYALTCVKSGGQTGQTQKMTSISILQYQRSDISFQRPNEKKHESDKFTVDMSWRFKIQSNEAR
ncbi:hypothetical protein RUM44_000219 [Polyplax serrata]|uniref:Uncharacterized protein n=1 Tax=Polyplax serrata TaxID=468196 RepID=A0ABR1B4U3_POLSC